MFMPSNVSASYEPARDEKLMQNLCFVLNRFRAVSRLHREREGLLEENQMPRAEDFSSPSIWKKEES